MIWIFAIAAALAILSSIADGVVEGFEFDGRKSFERKFGVAAHSFWGSKSYKNKDTWWFKVTGGVWDFYHLADDVRSWGYRLSGIALGAFFTLRFTLGYFLDNVQPKSLLLSSILYLVSYFAVGMLVKRVSMWWIRK